MVNKKKKKKMVSSKPLFVFLAQLRSVDFCIFWFLTTVARFKMEFGALFTFCVAIVSQSITKKKI